MIFVSLFKCPYSEVRVGRYFFVFRFPISFPDPLEKEGRIALLVAKLGLSVVPVLKVQYEIGH